MMQQQMQRQGTMQAQSPMMIQQQPMQRQITMQAPQGQQPIMMMPQQTEQLD